MNLVSKEQISREVFIVRLWSEAATPTAWRGQVQHVRSGQTSTVRNLEELLVYLRHQLNEPLSDSVDDHGWLK